MSILQTFESLTRVTLSSGLAAALTAAALWASPGTASAQAPESADTADTLAAVTAQVSPATEQPTQPTAEAPAPAAPAPAPPAAPVQAPPPAPVETADTAASRETSGAAPERAPSTPHSSVAPDSDVAATATPSHVTTPNAPAVQRRVAELVDGASQTAVTGAGAVPVADRVIGTAADTAVESGVVKRAAVSLLEIANPSRKALVSLLVPVATTAIQNLLSPAGLLPASAGEALSSQGPAPGLPAGLPPSRPFPTLGSAAIDGPSTTLQAAAAGVRPMQSPSAAVAGSSSGDGDRAQLSAARAMGGYADPAVVDGRDGPGDPGFPPPAPQAPAGVGSGSDGSSFVPLVALLALLALVAPATLRKRGLAPASLVPAQFVCALERPG